MSSGTLDPDPEPESVGLPSPDPRPGIRTDFRLPSKAKEQVKMVARAGYYETPSEALRAAANAVVMEHASVLATMRPAPDDVSFSPAFEAPCDDRVFLWIQESIEEEVDKLVTLGWYPSSSAAYRYGVSILLDRAPNVGGGDSG